MALLSMIFASQGVLPMMQKLPISGYSPSTATPVSIPEHAEEVIEISKSFNIDAQIVGRIEASDKKELIIRSEFGEFKY